MPEREQNCAEISAFLQDRGVAIHGFADLSPIPTEERYGFPRSIAFAFPIAKAILEQIKSGPTIDYFNEYNRLNDLLTTTAKELEAFIVSFGCKALAIDDTTRQYDTKALKTLLPHKTSAILAGLGWIGKCDLLITEKFGSGIRLGTVLTDMPLETGKPTLESECGNCRTCFELCPAKAIVGKNWKLGTKREELYDAFTCRTTARKLSDAIGANHSICGICIANCPRTLRYVKSDHVQVRPSGP
jgi:epoxyqueuosine reductase QueG